ATPVASLATFPAVWDSAEFELPSAAAGEPPTPALAVRLPGPVPGGIALDTGLNVASAYLAAFSRVCTHQQCIVSLNRDVTATDCSSGCNRVRGGPAFSSAWLVSVSDRRQGGKAVSGPAVRPLPRVRVEVRGAQLYATGIQRASRGLRAPRPASARSPRAGR